MQSPDGPFVVWDACLYNCEKLIEMDGEALTARGNSLITATVYVGLMHERSCAWTDPHDLHYQVLDNTIWTSS